MEKQNQERIAIKGTITRDAAVSRTEKGKLFTRLNIAADEVTIGGRKVSAEEHKWQTAVFWGVDAVDKGDLKKGTQVSLEGDRVLRPVEGHDKEMRTFSEIHHGDLKIEKLPRERPQGVPVNMTGEVLYDPELKATPRNSYYTLVTIRPQDSSDKVRAVFYGAEAMEHARTVRRGAQVQISGQLVEQEYTNPRDGAQTKGYEIHKGELQLLDKQRATERPGAHQHQQRESEQNLDR